MSYDENGNYVGDFDLADYQELADAGDDVGFNWGWAKKAGRFANRALNPVAQMRMLAGGGGGPRQGPSPQQMAQMQQQMAQMHQQMQPQMPVGPYAADYSNKPEILLAFSPSLGEFDANHGTVEFKAQPQKRFRPERLIIDFTRQGTTAQGIVLLEDLAVGTDPQAAALGGFPAAAFSPLAVATRLKLREADVGITITVRLRCEPVPQGTDRVIVAVGLIGRAI